MQSLNLLQNSSLIANEEIWYAARNWKSSVVSLCPYYSSLVLSKFKRYLQIKLLRSCNNGIFRQVIAFSNVLSLKTNCAKLLIALLFFIKEHTLYTQRNHLENIYIF